MGEGEDRTELAGVAEANTELAGAAEADTQSVYAWGQVDDLDELPEPWWTPKRITTATVMTSVVLTTAIVGLAVLYVGRGSGTASQPQTSTASTTAPPLARLQTAPTSTSPAPPTGPTPPVLQGIDGEFIAAMRGYGVPVNEQDPQWTIGLARAICLAAEDNPLRYPPSKGTVLLFVKYVRENNPGWSQQQATRLVHGGVDTYCPWVWGPSQQEIDAMPPDERYLAKLLDRLGITPLDNGVSLINAAHQWCSWKAQGWGNGQIVDATNLGDNDRKLLPEMVAIGIDVYCPELSGR